MEPISADSSSANVPHLPKVEVASSNLVSRSISYQNRRSTAPGTVSFLLVTPTAGTSAEKLKSRARQLGKVLGTWSVLGFKPSSDGEASTSSRRGISNSGG